MSKNALFNAVTRTLSTMFPGYFPGAKHNHYRDFGYPENLQFNQFFDMYERNGVAAAAVDKTVAKTWQDNPTLQEKPRDDGAQAKETRREKEIRERFADLRVWQHLAETDRRSLVGKYAGLILRFADSKPLEQPVDRVGGGLMGLVQVIPAWEGQLTVSQWDTDQTSETYGQPTMFMFNEAAVGQSNQPRSFQVHPDRVIVWSRDGTVHGRSALKPGYNDLMDLEKIKGGGAEGFWKNAKQSLVLEVDGVVKLAEMAKAMGVAPDGVADAMNDQVDDFQRGFDSALLLQGMKANPVNVELADPEHFFLNSLQSFASSMSIPLKILVGSQSGERASTEDADEWAQTNMSRRTSYTIPNILLLVDRLERVGILPERDWTLAWTPLAEAKPAEKIERAKKMVDANKASAEATGERVFTVAEVRAAAGDYEPLSEAEAKVEKPEPTPTPKADPPDGPKE